MSSLLKKSLFATSVLSLSFAAPAAFAQDSGAVEAGDIVVTARRTEERLQDVPISISVLNQEQLSNANVVNASDLARTTPGLVANERFGSDNSSFTIRGFTQELRTTPSVGVYFADVIAPRGGTPTTSGDGAGPGAFFDLANVQILKGPQGTLFGRNTTGGAVLLVPQRPTDELGGYVEGTLGDYNQERIQAVLNAPIGDSLRFRFGVDHNTRDGYLNNISANGPDSFNDVDYTALRASMVVDIAPNLENYTILSHLDSSNNGPAGQLFACNPGLVLSVNQQLCQGSLPSNGDFYDVQNSLATPRSEMTQWQAINTTTWDVTDNLTIKNILSFSNLENTLVSPIVGTDFDIADITSSINATVLGGLAAAPFGPGLAPGSSPHRYNVQMSNVIPGTPSVAQDSMVEELQFQGSALSDRLTWQAGLYYEHSEPSATQGFQGASNLLCDMSTIQGGDPAAFRCADTNYIVMRASGVSEARAELLFRGVANRSIGWTEFENRALYFQGSYDFSDQLSATFGYRYTWDETTGQMQSVLYYFNPGGTAVGDGIAPGNASTGNDLIAPTQIRCNDLNRTYAGNPADCTVNMAQSSNAPTWLLGLDYQPTEDVLLYAKYGRGYRQGGVNIASVTNSYTYEPEQVDTYEIGAKTSFEGAVPGIFNVSMFYNDFTNQQIQRGLLPVGGSGTTAIINTGATTIYGAEVDLTLELFEGFTVNASYSYLNTKFDRVSDIAITDPACGPGANNSFRGVCIAGGTPAGLQGFSTPYSPENSFAVTASYRLPTPETVGDVTISATYNYSGEYLAVMPASSLAALASPSQVNPFAEIPAHETVNLNLNWNNIAGAPVDGAIFVTNLFDEEYYSFVAGQYVSSGFEYRAIGQPFMAGARLRYRFGG